MEIELINRLIEEQLYKEALTLLEKVSGKEKESEILLLKAKIHFLMGKFNKTIEVLTTLIAQYPQKEKAYELLGETHRCLSNLEAAEHFYHKATTLNPRSWVSWLGRGKIALKIGDYQTAILCFKTYLNENDSAEIWELLAQTYLKTENYMEAVDAFNMAIEFDSLNKQLYAQLGALYEKMGYEDIAKEKYLQAIQIEEKTKTVDVDLYLKLIRILLKEERFQKAFSYCNEILNYEKENADALFLSGKALIGLGMIQQGKERIEKAFQKEKKDEFWDYLNRLDEELYRR